MLFMRKSTALPSATEALPGRAQAIPTATSHFVNGHNLKPPYPQGLEQAVFALGCFWGAERKFWEAEGVYTTAAGYAGGITPNPTYEEVCSGRTGHAEVVLVAFRADASSYEEMLKLFWEGHDPTQGMRQGNDVGTQYRSLIMWEGAAQREAAEASLKTYEQMLGAAGYGTITTELLEADAAHPFYYAEDYHQQYLHKNPGGYCPVHSTGIACPIGVNVSA